jgi:hypothetical protein
MSKNKGNRRDAEWSNEPPRRQERQGKNAKNAKLNHLDWFFLAFPVLALLASWRFVTLRSGCISELGGFWQ